MFFHVYGRNRFSKSLSLVSRNLRTKEEARKELKELRAGSGHDYTYTIKTTISPL
jgi:hypothetical protein